MIKKCAEWFESHDPGAPAPWFHYCSVNIPHPAFNTNATWLAKVKTELIPKPFWLPESEFHPADKYMSMSKNVWGTDISDAEILQVRKTYYAMCAETDWMLGTVMEIVHQSQSQAQIPFGLGYASVAASAPAAAAVSALARANSLGGASQR